MTRGNASGRSIQARVNKRIRELGRSEQLVRGEGYCYFTEGEAANWTSSTVYTLRISDLPVERWMEEYFELRRT